MSILSCKPKRPRIETKAFNLNKRNIRGFTTTTATLSTVAGIIFTIIMLIPVSFLLNSAPKPHAFVCFHTQSGSFIKLTVNVIKNSFMLLLKIIKVPLRHILLMFVLFSIIFLVRKFRIAHFQLDISAYIDFVTLGVTMGSLRHILKNAFEQMRPQKMAPGCNYELESKKPLTLQSTIGPGNGLPAAQGPASGARGTGVLIQMTVRVRLTVQFQLILLHNNRVAVQVTLISLQTNL